MKVIEILSFMHHGTWREKQDGGKHTEYDPYPIFYKTNREKAYTKRV